MNVLVDTSIWSVALRRDAPRGLAEERELVELLREDRIVMFGPVRQERLSGVRSAVQHELLRSTLRPFPDLQLGPDDYEEAARCFNRCRAKGIQGSNTDFLIAALSITRGVAVFTTDKDFRAFEKQLHVRLHTTRT